MANLDSTDHPPLLSSATILILSGFLIGISIGNAVGTELSPFLFACGLSGLLSFVVFEAANRRRAAQAAEEGQRQVERRLRKHVRPVSSHETRSNSEFRLIADPDDDDLDEPEPLIAGQTF